MSKLGPYLSQNTVTGYLSPNLKNINFKRRFLPGEVSTYTSFGYSPSSPPKLGIDLSNLVPELDKTASDIISNQRESTVQRKELAQRTKDFRKLDDASKITEIKVLLKGTCLLDTLWFILIGDPSLSDIY